MTGSSLLLGKTKACPDFVVSVCHYSPEEAKNYCSCSPNPNRLTLTLRQKLRMALDIARGEQKPCTEYRTAY